MSKNSQEDHFCSLILRDFMSHKHTVIDLDTTICSIVGESEHGKTNIQRAAQIALMGEDWPPSMIRDGCDQAIIEVHWKNRILITTRTKNKQTFEFLNKDGSSYFSEDASFVGKKNTKKYLEEFTKFKQVIVDSTKGPEDLNFISVDSKGPIFLGDYSTIQKRVAAILGNDRLDSTRRKVNNNLSRNKKLLENEKTRLSILKADLEAHQIFLDNIKPFLDQLDDFNQQRKNVVSYLNQIDNMTDQHLNLQNINHLLLIYESARLDVLSSDIELAKNLIKHRTVVCEVIDLLNIILHSLYEQQALNDLILRNTAEAEILNQNLPVCSKCKRPL